MIDVLTEQLVKLIVDEGKHPCTRAAAAKGYAILNKYYSRTDGSVMYRLCMSKLFVRFHVHLSKLGCPVLHPRYKLTWFKKMEWETEWIDTAVELFQTIYDEYYKPNVTQPDDVDDNVS